MILWKRLFHNICIDKMKALFPIKKEYVKKIFDGSKAYEYRKSFCSLEVDTIVIDESRGKGLFVGEFERGVILQEIYGKEQRGMLVYRKVTSFHISKGETRLVLMLSGMSMCS